MATKRKPTTTAADQAAIEAKAQRKSLHPAAASERAAILRRVQATSAEIDAQLSREAEIDARIARRQREGVHLSDAQAHHMSCALSDVFHGLRAVHRLAIEVSANPEYAEHFATAIENTAKLAAMKVDMIEQSITGGGGFGEFAHELRPYDPLYDPAAMRDE